MAESNLEHVSLKLSTLVVRNEGFIDAEIDNEVVALSIEKGTCYGLNGVGSRIWKLLATPIRISDICTSLLNEYQVERDVCERQVVGLLDELRTEGLIAVSEEK